MLARPRKALSTPRQRLGLRQSPAAFSTSPEESATNNAIAGTARNPASVGLFTGDFNEQPTQSEMRAATSKRATWRAQEVEQELAQLAVSVEGGRCIGCGAKWWSRPLGSSRARWAFGDFGCGGLGVVNLECQRTAPAFNKRWV
ncbi:MAG: hypothetical protein WCV00_04235 [Verrucomicrobiia bacterium]|jgi:hypothetical protein